MRVAIIGGNSHVAKNLIFANQASGRWEITAFGRNVEAIRAFADQNSRAVLCKSLSQFASSDGFDAIINCVGFGTPEKVKSAGLSLFKVPEEIDNLILDFVIANPKTRYTNFSSGAVYGTSMNRPAKSGQPAILEVSPLDPSEFYRISKIHQEAKHRSCPELSIVDVRLFSFFSRFIDPDSNYLMNDVIKSIETGQVLQTAPTEIYRDYISPADLYSLIDCILVSPSFNGTVDTYSKASISKSQLLANLGAEFGMKSEFVSAIQGSPTGTKAFYYSTNAESARAIGYRPQLDSWDTIREELKALGFKTLN